LGTTCPHRRLCEGYPFPAMGFFAKVFPDGMQGFRAGARARRRSMAAQGNDEAESMEMIAFRMGLIAPNGQKKVRWDWFMLGLVFYTGITVPFCLAFDPFTNIEVSPVGFAFDCIVDICYIIDIFVSWRTTYYDRDGILVMDKRKARSKYLRTWFPIDVIASFPFDYIGDLATIDSDDGIPPAVKLPSMLKLLRILRLGKKIDRLSSSKMFRIGQFTFMLLFAAHWYACLWFWVGGTAEPAPGEGIDPAAGMHGTSWVYQRDFRNQTVAMQYTASLYWAVTTLMKSPWFHPTSPGEFILALVMIICGCVLFAYFIGNVTAVITAANASGGRYRAQIGELKGFCDSHQINQKLAAKLLLYQDAQWSETSGGINRQDIMNRFVPTHLMPHVCIDMYKPMLTAMPFLLDLSSMGCVGFLKVLKVCVCERGDMLVSAGSVRHTMYILQRGEIKIDFDETAPLETAEIYAPGVRIGGPKKGLQKKKSAKDSVRGRTDKMGTMVAFQDVFKPPEALKYSATATKRCSLFYLTRGNLKELLTTYTDDRETVQKAIDHANSQIENSAGGGASVRRTSSASGMGLSKAAESARNSAGSEPPTPAASPMKAGEVAPPPSIDVNGSSEVKEDVKDLRAKLEKLTEVVMKQSDMIERQSTMIENMVKGGAVAAA